MAGTGWSALCILRSWCSVPVQERDWNKSGEGGFCRYTLELNTALSIGERDTHIKLGDGKQTYQLTRIGYSSLGQLLLNSAS